MAISSGAVVAVLSLFCCYRALGAGKGRRKEGDTLTNMCTTYDLGGQTNPLGIVVRKDRAKNTDSTYVNPLLSSEIKPVAIFQDAWLTTSGQMRTQSRGFPLYFRRWKNLRRETE
jgi:hypothetical protein